MNRNVKQLLSIELADVTYGTEVATAHGPEDLVDGGVGGQRAVEDVELSLEALRDVVAAAAGVDHGGDHLRVHDVGKLARLLQVIEALHLHHLTRDLIRHLL